jgi:hypothetical protein
MSEAASMSNLPPPPPETSAATVLKHLAYGEAAVLLVECLMHLLIDQRILTAQQMISAVENALAAKRQMIEEGEHAEIAAIAAGTLSVIANSLSAISSPSAAHQAEAL